MEKAKSISRKIRLRFQVKLCKNSAKITSRFRRDLKTLISKDICSASCEIHAVTLRCRTRKKTNILHVNFEIRMATDIIFSHANCKSSCARCKIENELENIVGRMRRWVNSNKFALSFDGQKYLLKRKDVKGLKTEIRCERVSKKNGKIIFKCLASKRVRFSQKRQKYLCLVDLKQKSPCF